MPDPTALTESDLAQLREQYCRLSTPTLQQVYLDALSRCQLDRAGRPPSADQLQVLVTSWRVLRQRKRPA